MLSLEVIKKYYPNASEDELKDIQEVVYLLACAVMQHFYGPWKIITRYFDENSKEPVRSTTETSRGK